MNGYNFTDRVRKVLQMAREEATRLQHEYVGTEHQLLAIVAEGESVAAAVLANLKVDAEDLVRRVRATVRPGTSTSKSLDLPYTSRAKKVLELAMSEARELNHSYVGVEHLLMGLIREEKGIAAQALQSVGVTRERARAEMLRILAAAPPDYPPLRRPSAAMRDQWFRSMIALIELHHRRFGDYPDSLADIRFAGPLDMAAFSAVKYEKVPNGYALDIMLIQGEQGLSYPLDFWRGLGLRRTNVKQDV